ncbi:MAG TPA: kinase [Elusimicrobiota bacterium]|nr:kinase [Elusimicrobiota bacterium]
MIITKTPFRISFFGGGTDYPTWYRENGGAVLSTSIDKYAYITCRYLPPFFEYKYRISYTLNEHVKEIGEIQHPSVRGCLNYLKIQPGLEIHYDGDLPARTGLGSSSTFTVGLLKSLYALTGKVVGNLELGHEAIHIEQNVIRENVGCQDQLAAAVGGLNHMEFGPDDRILVTPLIVSKERMNQLQSHLMLVFTGLSRVGVKLAGDIIQNTPKKKEELRAIQQMVKEALKILNSSADLTAFGKLLHESWNIKKTLADGITTPLVDDLYGAALKAGAVGGKLLGAGGGGFVLLFAPPERHGQIRESLKKFLHIPFEFENFGSQIVYYKPEDSLRWQFPAGR